MVVAVNEMNTRPSAMDESTILQNSILPGGGLLCPRWGLHRMSSISISVVLRRHPKELAAETTETLSESYPLKSGLQDGRPDLSARIGRAMMYVDAS